MATELLFQLFVYNLAGKSLSTERLFILRPVIFLVRGLLTGSKFSCGCPQTTFQRIQRQRYILNVVFEVLVGPAKHFFRARWSREAERTSHGTARTFSYAIFSRIDRERRTKSMNIKMKPNIRPRDNLPIFLNISQLTTSAAFRSAFPIW